MTDSLLVALRSYRPTARRNPVEDYITEAWAWLLRNTPGLWRLFERELVAVARGERRAHAAAHDVPVGLPSGVDPSSTRTQETTSAGRLDMVVDGPTGGWVFEHKVWASEGFGQLERYRTWAEATWPGSHAVVYVTASSRQWYREPGVESRVGPHVQVTWAFVECVCAEFVAASSVPHPIVEDFVMLLKSEGLGRPPELSSAGLQAYYAAQNVVPALRHVWRDLEERSHWAWLYERLPPTGDSDRPFRRWARGDLPREGRFGLDFYESWTPGIFFGVLLDPTDHKVSPSNPELGPDLVVIVSYNQEPGIEPSASAFETSPDFTALRTRLAADSGRWHFEDHLAARNKNPWHPLHLRRPLAEVVNGAQDADEQRERILSEGTAMLEWLLSGGELEQWVAHVRDSAGVG